MCKKINNYQNNIRSILSSGIDFYYFSDDEKCKHHFVEVNGDMVCISCGGTTADYKLESKTIKFLIECAKAQGMFLEEVKSDDIPLLNVLLLEKAYEIESRIDLDSVPEEERSDYIEEYWLEDESEISNMRRTIRWAHAMDLGERYGRRDFSVSYFNEFTKDHFLRRLDKEYGCDIDDVCMDEGYRTKFYEIHILSGYSINDLVESVINEDDFDCLVKGYFNLTDEQYRINSGYFKTDRDASNYFCCTANPVINQRILDLNLLAEKFNVCNRKHKEYSLVQKLKK